MTIDDDGPKDLLVAGVAVAALALGGCGDGGTEDFCEAVIDCGDSEYTSVSQCVEYLESYAAMPDAEGCTAELNALLDCYASELRASCDFDVDDGACDDVGREFDICQGDIEE